MAAACFVNTSQSSKRPQRMAASKAPQKGKLTFIDLPLETQKNICRYVRLGTLQQVEDRADNTSQVDQQDLLALLRVSRHFFSLAGAEIYRVLDFNFASSDVDSGAPISRTADALQAVVASDREYGLHIRSFRLGVSEENSHNALLMSRVLWDSVADPSKVLNTLILLMVKKAGMMESFLYVSLRAMLPPGRQVSTLIAFKMGYAD